MPGDYWIRAAPLQLGNTSNPNTTTSLGLAILRYTNQTGYAQEPSVNPYNSSQTPVPKNPLVEQNLHSYGNVSVCISFNHTPLDSSLSHCTGP